MIDGSINLPYSYHRGQVVTMVVFPRLALILPILNRILVASKVASQILDFSANHYDVYMSCFGGSPLARSTASVRQNDLALLVRTSVLIDYGLSRENTDQRM